MNDILKQRLVGALILVALGVVFWPIIFVEPGERSGAEQVTIPPSPQVDTSPVEPPDMAGLRPSREIDRTQAEEEEELLTLAPEKPAASNASATAKSTPEVPPAPEPVKPQPVAKTPSPEPEKKTRTEPPVKPKLDADGLPISWILRVASVSSASRADELRKDLVSMGHKAYVKKVKSGDKTLYRVYVGPKVEKAQLEKIQGGINSKFGVTTMITRYYP